MPSFLFDFAQPEQYTFDDVKVYASMECCRLRRHSTTGDYDITGIFEQAEIVFPEFNAEALSQWNGLAIQGVVPEDTSIDFQVSADGGTTWRYFNGTVWQTAGPTDWTTPENLDKGLPSLTSRRLILKARLTPNAPGSLTPLIRWVEVYFEARWNFFEDLKRSLKQYMDANMSCDLTWASVTASSGSSVLFDLGANQWTILQVQSVYDLTADPSRLTNLFSSYTPGSPGTIIGSGRASTGSSVSGQVCGFPGRRRRSSGLATSGRGHRGLSKPRRPAQLQEPVRIRADASRR
jgi:hypothetical protein